MGVACLGLARWGIGWINPCQEGINGSPYQFRYRHAFPLRSHMKTFHCFSDKETFVRFMLPSVLTYAIHWCKLSLPEHQSKGKRHAHLRVQS